MRATETESTAISCAGGKHSALASGTFLWSGAIAGLFAFFTLLHCSVAADRTGVTFALTAAEKIHRTVVVAFTVFPGLPDAVAALSCTIGCTSSVFAAISASTSYAIANYESASARNLAASIRAALRSALALDIRRTARAGFSEIWNAIAADCVAYACSCSADSKTVWARR